MMSVDAEASKEYDRIQVDKAFFDAGDNVTFDDRNKIIVDTRALVKGGMEYEDVKIINEYSELNNALIDAIVSEDKNAIKSAKHNLVYNQFSNVFNDENSLTTYGFWSSSACGITNGVTSTYPSTPTLYIGTDGHNTQADIETWLTNNGKHIVNWPFADWGDLVYAVTNSTGQGGCTNGEFRDEWNVYDNSVNHIIGGVTSSGWHTLNHDNEPNPEVLDYSVPTYWWTGFVVYWHEHF